MSYILEALKKAQAERQLGNAPTIHAPQAVPAVQPGAGAGRKPLYIGLAAGAVVVAAGALLLWHRAPGPAPNAVLAQAPAPLSVPAPLPAGAPRTSTLEVSAPPAPPEPRHPARVAEAPVRAAPAPQAVPGAPAAPAAPALAVTTAPTPARAATPAPAPTRAPAPEDSLPFLAQMPEAVQREIPRVSLGGYMYSANAADRLLLVDKALRHEGEEVVPGLVLEKLLPRAAVMNYRGYRYRVAL